ncbi:hypothetical protein IQ249_22850 [Lusitaniella coriacea LEGE 07157]|uniref:Uncharacterized protein n=1 Tax=Lusitaniella coriacea LEGE 07157 TaxID=945747 RepID=A0A8J7E0B2_9CYAN|nr:hypothetical protein [Lusitaniella coriacea]MBE9118733.1 hypothetical protein [Lusitaniella coriacea LEGE 07157]
MNLDRTDALASILEKGKYNLHVRVYRNQSLSIHSLMINLIIPIIAPQTTLKAIDRSI